MFYLDPSVVLLSMSVVDRGLESQSCQTKNNKSLESMHRWGVKTGWFRMIGLYELLGIPTT
jgi:hypothetical protein